MQCVTTACNLPCKKHEFRDLELLLQKLLEELESLEVPAEIRESRLQSLKHEAAQYAVMHERKHGQYTYAGFVCLCRTR